jgi:hypothetical protein
MLVENKRRDCFNMIKQYRVLRAIAIAVIAIVVTSGIAACSSIPGLQPTNTPIPFARFNAQQVFDAFAAAGLGFQNPVSDLQAGRGAPLTFNERYIFEIPRIAPLGGQVVIFRTPDDLQAWEEWIADLRNDPTTRRDVVYVYTNGNAMIQLNASLTNVEAGAFRDVFLGLE